jgi:hypothetical protein
MLSERFDPTTLPEPGAWAPYPDGSDRPFWERLPGAFTTMVLARAEASLAEPWPVLPASLGLLFLREGRRDYEGPMAWRRVHLMHLALGALVDGGDRFVDAVANAVWSICEESAWNYPAHLHEQGAGSGLPDVTDPLVDLGVGDTAALLAWVSYLLADELDAVSPLLRERIAIECRRRVLEPIASGKPHHWQRAVNNWNPWIISNVLPVALIVERDRPFRDAVLRSAVATLDHFIDHYPPDGGCDEGPTYWTRAGGNLILCLDVLHSATGGALDVYGHPLIGEIGRYVHRMFIGDDWFVNFADGAGRFPLPSTAWRYGRAIGDEGLTKLGYEHVRRTMQAEPRFLEGFASLLPLLPHLGDLLEAAPIAVPLVREAVLPDIQVLVARDVEDSTDGWFAASKGGHNAEVHNHNDVGSIVVFLDAEPLLVDAGVGPYTRATFSHERYTIWTMQSGWHNVPVINGVEQRDGRDFAASGWSTAIADDVVSSTVDLAGAYPSEAGVERWERTVTLRRGDGVDVTERWRFKARTGGAELRLLTVHQPEVIDARSVRLGPAVVRLLGDHDASITTVSRSIADEGLMPGVWGSTLHRVDITLASLPREGEVHLEVRRTS